MKRILLGIISLFFVYGCANVQRYEMQNLPVICVAGNPSIVEDKFMDFLDQGHSITYVTEWWPLNKKHRIVSFYVEEENLLYTVNDIETILTQMWYIKGNAELPSWPLNYELFRINKRTIGRTK